MRHLAFSFQQVILGLLHSFGGLLLFLATLLAGIFGLLVVAEVLLKALLLDLAEGYLVAGFVFRFFLLLLSGSLGLLGVRSGSDKKLDAYSGYMTLLT